MSHSPRWLSALMRVREHRRDAALQSLGKSLLAARTASEATQATATEISLLTATQQDRSLHHVDVDRLRHLRANRDHLRAEFVERLQLQAEADEGVKQAHAIAVTQNSEVEILVRLSDRYQTANRIIEKRREEQNLAEAAVTLCNGDRSA